MSGPRRLGDITREIVADLDQRRRCECPGSKYGLWSDTTPPAERTARLRALRALVRVFAGPAGADADAALARAEAEPGVIGDAVAAVDRLPPLSMRRILSTYAALHKPRGGE